MNIPEPEPGLVIGYTFLWRHEADAGQEEGAKHRPCAIVAAIRRGAGAPSRVIVLPITHTPPSGDTVAVEIPPAVKRHLKLDDLPSWIIVSEGNDFFWPGPDLRPTAHDPDTTAYGFLPLGLFARVQKAFLDLHVSGQISPVKRTE